MKITVIGASAGVGLETVKRALERGHHVTTLSRSPINLEPHKNLVSLKGNATKKEDLKETIENAEAVIVALGTGKNVKKTFLYTDFAKAILEINKEKPIDIPVIILTGFGAGESGKYHTFLMKLFFRFILNKIYENKSEMEEMISKSNLKWEFVRPGILNDKPLSEKYRIETKLFKGINIGNISRKDVADFMIKECENLQYIHQYPALSKQ